VKGGELKSNHNGQNFKALLSLTVLVLLVHIALLNTAPLSLGHNPPPPAKPFITRTVVAGSSPTKASKAAKPPDSTQSVQQTQVRPRPVTSPAADAVTTSRTPDTTPETAPENAAPEPAAPASAPLADAPIEAITPEPVAEVTAAPRAARELTTQTEAVRLPGSALVKYKVEANKFPYNANGELLWQTEGQQYKARLSFSAFGQTRMQTSQGQITPEGLAPARFADKYRSEVAAHFNREQGKVTFSANTPDVPLLAGAQDRLSVILQLAALIAANPAQFAPATTVTIQVVSARDADTWLFTVGEEETLSLAGGEQRALKLVRNPRQPYDQKVELWLGTRLDYLPVRLKITEANGDFIDQKWQSIEAAP
jgi:hypothetical protein